MNYTRSDFLADIHKLVLSEKVKERKIALAHDQRFFVTLQNEQLAWDDLIHLTQDTDFDIRREAAILLGGVFRRISDKDLAWENLHRLTQNDDEAVRIGTVIALSYAFQHIPDKEQAWKDLIRLLKELNGCPSEYEVRFILELAFSHIPDKNRGWKDLIHLTQQRTSYTVRHGAVDALGFAFSHLPDKKQAWNDLHQLAQDTDNRLREGIAHTLSSTFPHIPNKEQASEDLHRFTQDTDIAVRVGAAYALGSAFQFIPDKKQALDKLTMLTEDNERNVRVFANHSLGRAYIFRAIEAQSEEEFRKELENSLNFFEKSANEDIGLNPSQFCFPFYSLFYTITFKKEEAEAEVPKYLAVMKNTVKNIVEYSESKEKLLEAIENLANALKEAHKAREIGLKAIQTDLNAYRRYCERAADLLDATEENAPGATKLIRKGLPIIDERIKGIIGEIQEKSKTLCKQTKGTSFEDLGKEVSRQGQSLLQIGDSIKLEKSVNNFLFALSAICAKMPSKDRGEACELIKLAHKERYVEDILNLINMALPKISSQLTYTEEIEKVHKTLIKIETSCDRIIHDLEDGGVKLKDDDKEELKTLAIDLRKANQEQLENIKNKLDELKKWLEDPKRQEQIEKAPEKDKPKIKNIFSRIIGELGIALTSAITAEALLPRIEAIMSEIKILSGINPALASTLILLLITIKKSLK